MVALQVQGFCGIFAVFLAPIIPQIGLYGLKYKAFSIIQCTLYYNISLILDLSTFILSETGFRLTLPRDTAHYFSPIRSENRKK